MSEKLHILLWRAWAPFYDYPAVYSSLEKYSMGGTCSQLLWHAKGLAEMGHSVQVLGATRVDMMEEGVEFLGAANRSDQERLIASGRIARPDVVFLEGAFSSAGFFKKNFTGSKIVHISQNIDRYDDRAAFKMEGFIDVYAFVGIGQMADYCVRYPKLRHKFFLVRNIVPWERIYSKIERQSPENRVAWVGAWTKKGLRRWAETMERILSENSSYQWNLYGPMHGAHIPQEIPGAIFRGLNLPMDRILIKSLPMPQLAKEMSKACVVLVSLGNECGPISILDAHAMGRPVLSGNDMVYKYANPEGTGIRVTTAEERYEALNTLIQDAQLRDSLGQAGLELVLSNYAEKDQKDDLKNLLDYLKLKDPLGKCTAYASPGRFREHIIDWQDKLKRKLLRVFKT